MRCILLLISYFTLLSSVSAQEDFLAKRYFEDGAFDKAVVFYEKLVEKEPTRIDYAEGLIASYQQLERYEDAENFLLRVLARAKHDPSFNIELGYNFAIQNNSEKANEYYNKAISVIDENPYYSYGMGIRFQKHALLEYAIKAYSKGMELNPDLDYNYQMARLYGEQGNIDKMFTSYLSLIRKGKSSLSNVLRNFDDFVSEDPEAENNIKLKTILLQSAQKDPNVVWNQLLSWLFVQQKQYNSAFRQEKAIYKRMDGARMQRLENLGDIALKDSDTEVAQSIFEYIIENSNDEVTKLNAQLNIIDIQLLNADEKALNAVQKQYDELLEIHGYKSQTKF